MKVRPLVISGGTAKEAGANAIQAGKREDDGAKKLHALTGLRFVAAAMIVIHHSRGVFWLSKEFLGGIPLQAGVSFFFVLSGFILAHVYPNLSGPLAIRRFLVARFARIWPAHFLTFLLAILLGLHETGASWFALVAIANAAMLHAWIPVTACFFSFNAVSWSISTEFFFYFAFPLLIAGLRQTWHWKGVLIGSVVIAMLLWSEHAAIPAFATAAPFEINRAGILYISPLTRLAEFFLGMLAAMLWSRYNAAFRMKQGIATLLECVCVGFCAGAITLISDRTALQQNLGESVAAYLRHTGAAPAFALLIVVFASQQGWISRGCGTRGMVLLGEISFSVYLLHQLFLRWLVAHRELLTRTGLGEGMIYAGFCLALLAASWLAWRGIERPARLFLVRLASPSPV
ncbi:MAG: acyltransferase [Verrucomicrobiota bacterium]